MMHSQHLYAHMGKMHCQQICGNVNITMLHWRRVHYTLLMEATKL